MWCPWSSSISSVSGCSASTARRAWARAALSAAPVGFCARSVTISARAPPSSALRTSSGSGPSSSTGTGTVRRPSAGIRSSRLPHPGSSTTTASPGRRWAASTRSTASSAPEVTATGPSGTPSASSPARARRSSPPSTGVCPYSTGSRSPWAAAAAYAPASAGSSAGSGLPSDRSRTPGGTSTRIISRAVVAGLGRTRLPRRPAVSMTPRSRRVRYAAATVFGFTPSRSANSRMGGSSSPGCRAPSPTARSMLAEISAARRPLIRYSPSTNHIMH